MNLKRICPSRLTTRCAALALALALLLCCPVAGVFTKVRASVGDSPVVVGGDHNYPPYEFIDGSGQPSGYNVELSRAIAEVMGIEVQIRLGDWDSMRKALAAGTVDILQGMAYSPDRVSEVDYSPPHTIVYQSIWTRRDGPAISSVEGLGGKQVIVMRGSIMHDFMLERGLGATLVPTDTLADALRLLASGRHDCALVAKLPGEYLVEEFQLTNIAPLARPIAEQPYGYAVKKGNTAMLSRFSEGLAILKKTGRYQQIHNRWLGVLEPAGIPWWRLVRYGAMIIVPLLLVLGGTLAWSRTLKKEVAHRTSELEKEVGERKRVIEELEIRQRQLIQADKMTSLGILVSGVAHEINNPTGLILLNLPHLIKAYEDAEPILDAYAREHGDFKLGWLNYSRMRDEIPHMLSEMQEGAKRIKNIVEDLKDFARRDDSDLSASVDLNTVVADSLRLVDNSIRNATEHFTVELADELPKFRGNPQRIEQVVVNLVLNACQALTEKGQGIFLHTVYLAEEGVVALEVKDQGVGVALEQLEHLTDPFFTTRREEGGTGLGLSISAGIVKEHGGSLEFNSAPGKGMTVMLKLPIKEAGSTA